MIDKVPWTALAKLLCSTFKLTLKHFSFWASMCRKLKEWAFYKNVLTVQNQILQSWRSKSSSFIVCDSCCARHLGYIFKLLLSHSLYPGKTSTGLCIETDVLILHIRFWALDNYFIFFFYLLASLCASCFRLVLCVTAKGVVLLPSLDVAGSICFGWVRKYRRNLRCSGIGLSSLPEFNSLYLRDCNTVGYFKSS